MNRRPLLSKYFPVELLERRFLFDTTLDIAGVQPAAFDQPQIYEILRQSPNGDPLQVDDGAGDQVLGTIQAFLDTGTSGNVLSEETTSELGLTNATYGNPPQDVLFDDVGVAGDQPFNVSEPLYPSFAPYPQDPQDGGDPTTYSQPAAPAKYELNPTPIDDGGDGGLGLVEPVDIVGMTAIDGNVMVMDPKPTDQIANMNTYLYPPGTPYNADTADTNPGIPDTSYKVQVSTADFSRFTSLFPDDAPGPTLAGNPMIGPDPVKELDGSAPDSTPPVSISMGNYSTTGSFLLDTGSATSFMSQGMASRVHVYYSSDPAHSYLSDDPMLVDDTGQPIANQFTLAVGGTGSAETFSGFFLDSLSLQTTDPSGLKLRFLGAPVLVLDVTLQDPNTGQGFVLDGDFGMNYLVASANIDSSGNISAASGAPFDWVTYDQPAGLVGFEPSSGGSLGLYSQIIDRHVFYNNSSFDGLQVGNSVGDNAAIAPDKTALLPGDTATFANYTSYTSGINGVMVDIAGEPDITAISTADFQFKVGNNNDPSSWQTLAVQPTLTTREFDGTESSDRVDLTWPDNTIKGEWLQVTMFSDDNTGLASDDVFYFGNAPGESGNSDTDAGVNVMDVLGARGREAVGGVGITSPWDYNRDGVINNDDVLAARGNQTSGASVLSLIDAPMTGALAFHAAAVKDHLTAGSLKPVSEHLTITPDAAAAPQTSNTVDAMSAQVLLPPATANQTVAIDSVQGVWLTAAMLTAGSLQPAQPIAAGELFSQVPVVLHPDALRSPLWLERRLPLRHRTNPTTLPFNDGAAGALTTTLSEVTLY